jgi:6-phosphogluconolactonase
MSRRDFLATSAAVLASASTPSFGAGAARTRLFVSSNTPQGMLAFDWNASTGELTHAGDAARLDNVDWIAFSPDRKYIFAASEVDSFNGKPTGAVASYEYSGGKLTQISAQNSAAKGTCHVAVDRTGRVLLSADYGGGSAASFKIANGRLSAAVWTEHYRGSGPVTDRQEAAHAHFASFSPDNRFAYFNDLGSDRIHIYALDTETAQLKAAGAFKSKPGSGPRTLHFHPNGVTAYCMNELNSTVDVLHWNQADGSFTFVTRVDLLPPGDHGQSTGCDTVITRDGRNVYFSNRFNDFIYAFSADQKAGTLSPIGRTSTGGKIPRNFTLDPTERWMLVANQDSNNVAVFARNPQTGALAGEGKSIDSPAPMCILFA